MAKANLNTILDKLKPGVRKAFLEAFAVIRSDVQIGQLVKSIDQGDISGAIEALSLNREAFGAFEAKIAEVYAAGGAAGVASMPRLPNPNGGRFVVRFNVRNPRAEQWLEDYSSKLVTRVVNEQRKTIRLAMAAGLRRGDNPRRTALDLAGRINPISKRREGGLIGLSGPQADYVDNARLELLSGDPKRMQNYLTRKRRDKRYDPAVRRAIADGRPLPRKTVDAASGRYSDQLLRLRGETIGRTETLTSLHAGQHESFRQAIESGAIQERNVRRVWRTASDSRVRDEHVSMEGETVGFNELFSNGLMFPSEPNCRCYVENVIDFLAGVGPAQEAPLLPPATPKPAARRVTPPSASPAARAVGLAYRNFTAPKNVSEMNQFIVDAGIAKGADLKGFKPADMAAPLKAAQETIDRFGLKPLDFFGPISRTSLFRRNSVKGAGAAVFHSVDARGNVAHSALHIPTKFGKSADTVSNPDRLKALSARFVKERDNALDNPNNKFDKDAIAAARKVKENEYGWAVQYHYSNETQTLIYHEFGHVLHIINEEIGAEINTFLKTYKPRQKGWQFAVSKYGASNDFEYVAEAFAIYMRLPAPEHFRIHPELLKIFVRFDKENVA